MNINEIRLRYPFILLDKKSSTYYMYGTNNNYELGFYCYYSKDLSSWNLQDPYRSGCYNHHYDHYSATRCHRPSGRASCPRP